MFLKDNHADIKLSRLDSGSFEVWWLHEDKILAVSHCPENYPATMIHTMTLGDAVTELLRLIAEGWRLEKCSDSLRLLTRDELPTILH